SPPTSSFSTMATLSPPCLARSATFWPTGPAPMTITSKFCWTTVPPQIAMGGRQHRAVGYRWHMDQDDIAGGYRHYKGGLYEVLGLARHSETEEELVVYASASGAWWVRPRSMFFERVTADGASVPRFVRA